MTGEKYHSFGSVMPHEVLSMPLISAKAQNIVLAHGHHIPTVVVESSYGTAQVNIERLADTHEEKAQQFFTIGFLLAESSEVGVLHQIFFISEAWLTRSDKETQQSSRLDKQRMEALIISRTQLEPFAKELLILEMLRNAEQKVIELKPHIHMLETDKQLVESPLVEAFIGGYIRGLMNIK